MRSNRDSVKVVAKLKAGEITQVIAGQMLNMSDRNIRKKLKRYREKGDAGGSHWVCCGGRLNRKDGKH